MILRVSENIFNKIELQKVKKELEAVKSELGFLFNNYKNNNYQYPQVDYKVRYLQPPTDYKIDYYYNQYTSSYLNRKYKF